VYSDRPRVGRLHLGHWTNAAIAGGEQVKDIIMVTQCVGSRMDNGGRILETPRRHAATQ
jgi:hypothetical protein